MMDPPARIYPINNGMGDSINYQTNRHVNNNISLYNNHSPNNDASYTTIDLETVQIDASTPKANNIASSVSNHVNASPRNLVNPLVNNIIESPRNSALAPAPRELQRCISILSSGHIFTLHTLEHNNSVHTSKKV